MESKSNKGPDISVVLCTYNRAQMLGIVLESVLASCVAPAISWEIVVIDNNSSDETQVVVEEFRRSYPDRIQYIFEPAQGLSYARNAGVRRARGEIIAFVDDDVSVDPMWLSNLTAQLRSRQCVGAGGRILLRWTIPPPRWLEVRGRDTLSPFAMFDLGPDGRELTESPVGANMAYRREVFDKYGLFRTDLGRCAASLMSSEDTEFGARVLGGGEKLWYASTAVVYHPVPQERLQKEYLLNWHFSNGRSTMRRFGGRPSTKGYIGGIPLYLLRRIVAWTIRWTLATTPSRRFSSKTKVWTMAGQLFEYCHYVRRKTSLRKPAEAFKGSDHNSRVTTLPASDTEIRSA